MIPNTLHVVWIQGRDAMPDNVKYNLRTWAVTNPDMTIMVHDDASICTILGEWPGLLDRYGEAPNFPSKKDIAQFAIVHKYGGLFVDADMQCQKSVLPLLAGNTLLVFSEQDDNGLASKRARPSLKSLGAIPGHPLLQTVIKAISKNNYRKGLETPLTYITRNAKFFVDIVRDGWEELLGTPLQFFLQAPLTFGLADPDKHMDPIMQPSAESYAFPSGKSGTWHNIFQKSYHCMVFHYHKNKNAIRFTLSVFMFFLVIFIIVGLSVLLHRTQKHPVLYAKN